MTNERRALGRKLRTNEKNFLGMLKESGAFRSEENFSCELAHL